MTTKPRITRDNIWENIRRVHPELRMAFDDVRHKNTYQNPDDDEVPDYEYISKLVDFCIFRHARGDHSLVQNVFDEIENWLLQGNEYVREIATVGFIEGIQNANLHKKTNPESFRQYLGCEGKYWWSKVERFWSCGEMLKDDRSNIGN